MPAAVIDLTFDPVLHLGDLEVRVATVFLAGILLAGLLLAARIGHLTPQPGPYVPPPPLRPDDIPFLVLGIVPGAVIGGRIEYVLIHLDYYAVNPTAIVDPAQGGLGLALAVLGGILGGLAIARLAGAPGARWMHASTLAVLFILAAGKLASMLAADGQGLPTDVAWATAYHGPGPWGSLGPDIPSHPAQVYEALTTTIVLVVIGLALQAGAFGRKDGSVLLIAVALWALGRASVAFSWRDAPVAGPFLAEHLILVVVIGACLVGLGRLGLDARRERRARRSTAG